MNARKVAVVIAAIIGWFGVSASAQDKTRLGIVAASGCYFLNMAEVDGERTLVADNICEYGLDEAWEGHLTELLSDSGKYEPVPVEIDRETMRMVLHGEVSTDPFKPVFYTHKEHSDSLATVAQENGVDALLILRAYGNRLNNGWWMNHTGIKQMPWGRKPVLYYGAQLMLVGADGKLIGKSQRVKGKRAGDWSNYPQLALDKALGRKSWAELNEEKRGDVIEKLDQIARDAIARTLPKVAR